MNTKTVKEIEKSGKDPFVYGYKALDENLCASMGDGMQFKVGETYEVEGKLRFCYNGFHFCENLEDTLNYYAPSKSLRFVKIKAYGEILSDSRHPKQLCRKIKVVEEVLKKDILKFFRLNENVSTEAEILEKSIEIREFLASKGFFLKILINDENWRVRAAVASQSYGLDILIKDKHTEVRRAVAEQGYGLEILVKDENLYVRRAVAEQGYGLDILINDENPNVRRAVAEQGYGLNVLINDKEWYVRRAVAEQGYGLDILVNDENLNVRCTVHYLLAKLNENVYLAQ